MEKGIENGQVIDCNQSNVRVARTINQLNLF